MSSRAHRVVADGAAKANSTGVMDVVEGRLLNLRTTVNALVELA